MLRSVFVLVSGVGGGSIFVSSEASGGGGSVFVSAEASGGGLVLVSAEASGGGGSDLVSGISGGGPAPTPDHFAGSILVCLNAVKAAVIPAMVFATNAAMNIPRSPHMAAPASARGIYRPAAWNRESTIE